MSSKTDRQIFIDEIFDRIDKTVRVKEIIDDGDPQVKFTVCELKWMRVGQPFTDIRSDIWTISAIDFEAKEITTLRPAEFAVLNKNELISIIQPYFRSGTPVNVNNEIPKSVQQDLKQAMPLVWLKENIDGYDLEEDASFSREANYVLFCLDDVSDADWLNEERHEQGVIPMHALKEEIMRVIKANPRLLMEGRTYSKAFPFFGKEASDSMEAFILDQKLAGVEFRPTVQVTRAGCEC